MMRDELIQAIEHAFSDTEYPGDTGLVDDPDDWEADETQVEFRGRHWHDIVDPQFLMRHRSLYFFSPEAFEFYLPAYLIGVLRYPAEGLEWSGELLSALYPKSTPYWGERWLKRWNTRMGRLSEVQKAHSTACS